MSNPNGGPNWQLSRSRRPHLFVKNGTDFCSCPHLDSLVQGGGARTCRIVSRWRTSAVRVGREGWPRCCSTKSYRSHLGYYRPDYNKGLEQGMMSKGLCVTWLGLLASHWLPLIDWPALPGQSALPLISRNARSSEEEVEENTVLFEALGLEDAQPARP